MRLTDEQIELYSRQIILREVGGTGQVALRAARVRVIGSGAAVEACASYLVGAGVGIVDLDARPAIGGGTQALPLPDAGHRTPDASVGRVADEPDASAATTCDVVLDLDIAAQREPPETAPTAAATPRSARCGAIVLRADSGGGFCLLVLPAGTGCPACTRPAAAALGSSLPTPGPIASASAGALAALICCRWLLGIGTDTEARVLALPAGSAIWADAAPPARIACPRGCPPPVQPV